MKEAQIAYHRVSAQPGQFPRNLSGKEREVVESYAELGSIKAVARALDISPHTVADHLKIVRIKAGAHDTVVVVARYFKAQIPPARTVPA